jgi:ATP-dependent helicase/nuclease subunit A
VELAVIESGTNSAFIEAYFIAERAMELYGGGDSDSHYSYGDMALLLRKGTATRPYEEAFLRNGIPFINLAGGKLADCPEIYDIGNILSWICNPDDPVLLTGVLISPFFSIDPDTLFLLKTAAGSPEKMPKFILNNKEFHRFGFPDSSVIEKVQKTLKMLLSLSDRLTLRELIETACDTTHYTLTLLPDTIRGEQSLALIDHILKTAGEFEMNGGSLRDFARLLLDGRPFSDEIAQVENKGDALTILTIHRAKGLEFKVVFCADISGRIKADTHDIVFNTGLGPGFKIRDAYGTKIKTYVNRISEENEGKMELAESKRIFYVGCTRAIDHLIISGKKPSKRSVASSDTNNWMAWLYKAFSIPVDNDENYSHELFGFRKITEQKSQDALPRSSHWKALLKQGKNTEVISEKPIDFLTEPVKKLPVCGVPEHISPTRILDYITCPALYLYRYIHHLELPFRGTPADGMGAAYGRFAHAVFEKLNYRGDGDYTTIIQAFAGKEIPDCLKDKLSRELAQFKESNLFKWVGEADAVYREEPFAFVHDDVVIRGTIDLMCRKGNDIVLVDFKTDAVRDTELSHIVKPYELQLKLYALAVFRAYGHVPAGLFLYFLTPNVSCSIDCSHRELEGVSETLSTIFSRMASGDFFPVMGVQCGSCPYERLCFLSQNNARNKLP